MHRSSNIIQPLEASRLSWRDKWRRYVRFLDRSKPRHNTPGFFESLRNDIVREFDDLTLPAWL